MLELFPTNYSTLIFLLELFPTVNPNKKIKYSTNTFFEQNISARIISNSQVK